MMKIKLQVGRDNDGKDDEYDDVANILHADDEAFDAIAVAKSLDQEPFAKTYKTSSETSYCCWGCSSENETFFAQLKTRRTPTLETPQQHCRHPKKSI